MSSEWKIFKLSEICTKIGSGATPTGGKSSYNEEGEFALIRSQNVLDFVFSFDGLAYINNSQAQKLSNVEIQKEDVLINITGDSVARVCMVPNEVLPARVNQHVSILRADTSLFSPRLLKYLLLTGENKAKLLTLASSGATRNALTKSMLENFEVFAPEDVDEQEKLANAFQSLDDKIANNNRINQTLEEIAQALFKSWFVDFEPVKAKIQALEEGTDPQLAAMCAISGKSEEELQQLPKEKYKELAATASLFPDELVESELGLIPKGWKVGTIDNVTSLIIDHRGKTPKKMGGDWSETGIPAISAKNIKNGELIKPEAIRSVSYSMYKKWMVEELGYGDIIMTSEAPLGETYFLADNTKYCLSQRLFAMRADARMVTPEFLYYFILGDNFRSEIESRSSGSTVTGIRQVELRKVKVLVPKYELVQTFSSKVKPLLQYKNENNRISQNLRDTRDLLLPNLLSGKLM